MAVLPARLQAAQIFGNDMNYNHFTSNSAAR